MAALIASTASNCLATTSKICPLLFLSGKVCSQSNTHQLRTFKSFPFPVTFENVVFPPDGQMKLPELPKQPTFDPALSERAHKVTKRLIEARGPEEVHTMLIHRQFGLRALSGAFLTHKVLELLRQRINLNLQRNQFAVWRVDAPWLPRTKKPSGRALGGGKGHISEYVTPVRAGRILVELGGHVIKEEAIAYLAYLGDSMPCQCDVVSEESLRAEREEEERLRNLNVNRFDFEFVAKWNMQNLSKWMSTYDVRWKGKYK